MIIRVNCEHVTAKLTCPNRLQKKNKAKAMTHLHPCQIRMFLIDMPMFIRPTYLHMNLILAYKVHTVLA